jgi:hypothetical protein
LYYLKFFKIHNFITRSINAFKDPLNVLLRHIISDGFQVQDNLRQREAAAAITVDALEQGKKLLK